ncbi:MAG: DUF2189 domain-containing protein [Rhodospirillales bacterium]|nr:DUF2189 domain-containing protein [Rhodospirillales bacterium]
MNTSTPARNPVVWGWDQVRAAVAGLEAARHHELDHSVPRIRALTGADLREALLAGYDDFRADHTHYLFMCAIYPVIGLILGQAASGAGALHLIFPLAAGFALLGPFAAVGLYELSLRRERGEDVAWWHAFAVFRAPNFGAILKLGLALTALFVLWLIAAEGIWRLTLGRFAPASPGELLGMVLGTRIGWVLMLVGNGVGFLFALAALVLGVISFPMMVDRQVGVELAVRTSFEAVRANKAVFAGWGIVVAATLLAGSVPFLIGLAVAIPVLGHATWHLYRRAVGFTAG